LEQWTRFRSGFPIAPENPAKHVKERVCFTPSICEVKIFCATLSAVFSIECSPSTGPCRKSVQLRIADSTGVIFGAIFAAWMDVQDWDPVVKNAPAIVNIWQKPLA
jgi:hypothetical protein